jgi:hypothetical protein
MSERPKEHDWKSCVESKSFTVGSNPTLSAIYTRFCAVTFRSYRLWACIDQRIIWRSNTCFIA